MLACQSLMAQLGLACIDWLHGEVDCETARAAPDYVEWQQVTYTANTFIFHQNKCSNSEAPLVYLFVGEDTSLLIDTGATEAGGPMRLELVRDITGSLLVVAHSHGHGDHTAGDEAFAKAEAVELVGTGAEAVQAFSVSAVGPIRLRPWIWAIARWSCSLFLVIPWMTWLITIQPPICW